MRIVLRRPAGPARGERAADRPWRRPGGAGDVDHACALRPRPQPAPMTLDGTNTWVLGRGSPGAEVLVVDPGPDDQEHLARGRRGAARAAGSPPVLLTHGHLDHSERRRAFAELVGAPVRALDPRTGWARRGSATATCVTAGGLEVDVVGTPGHIVRLALLLAAAGPGAAHRRHGARPGYAPWSPPGRRPRRLPALPRPAAGDGRARPGSEALLPGHGPVLHDPLRCPRRLPRAPAASGWTRCGRRRRRGGGTPGRSSRRSTPTWTGALARRRARSARSSPTSG